MEMTYVYKGDFMVISALDRFNLNKSDNNGRTILHLSALCFNVDLLFVCLQLDIDEKITDIFKNTFKCYLKKWMMDKLELLQTAQFYGHLDVIKYKDNLEAVSTFNYDKCGKPSICLLWEKRYDPNELITFLEYGIDLDDYYIKAATPDSIYVDILKKYGWFNDKEPNKYYYIPSLWKGSEKMTFKINPINEIPIRLFNRTIVCVSDIHGRQDKLFIPGGDILLISGDITASSNTDISAFINWLGKQTHTFKVMIMGNHDKAFEEHKDQYILQCKENNIIYLEDSGVKLLGINIWGSPWIAIRKNHKNNAFAIPRNELIHKWNLIPDNTNILMTHCPPYGIGDLNTNYYKATHFHSGDYSLRKTINRLGSLRLHTFGHQHYGRGIYKGDNGVYFVNCSVVNDNVAFVFN